MRKTSSTTASWSVQALEPGQLRRWKYATNTPMGFKRMGRVILVIEELHDRGGRGGVWEVLEEGVKKYLSRNTIEKWSELLNG